MEDALSFKKTFFHHAIHQVFSRRFGAGARMARPPNF
jgi:hypothetical protein